MPKTLVAFILFALSCNLWSASFAQNTVMQKKMAAFMDAMAGVYDSMYAPALWKKEFSGWNLEAEVEKAKDKIFSQELSVAEFHGVVNDFILSMKDYHVSVGFYATEKASLPFMVRGTEDRLFFVYIDREKLPRKSFPFELGDELLSMNGKKAVDIVAAIKTEMGGNVDETDLALAQMRLTSRKASSSLSVPRGPVELEIKKAKDGSVATRQLIWDYQDESVLRAKSKLLARHFAEEKPSLSPKLEMSSALAVELDKQAKDDNRFGIGARSSFLPPLGGKIWESDKENHFDAYIYQNENKELVGYVRIPKYGAGEEESKQFRQIIKRFEKTTDKLVIDQLNNPGGSVFYLYSLVSMLSPETMATPKHYMAVNQEMVVEAVTALKELESVKKLEELKKLMGGETVGGYPVSMTFMEFLKEYYRFLIEEWNAGKALTSPHHLYGVDKINPDPEVAYTKPILLLVNELDFSGGDFFPAIMQDNGRATIMGVRTAGAGGYVKGVKIPNQLGVGGFRFTGSLADRVDHTPIENLGVTPDIEYRFGAEDYQKGFKSFKARINKAIQEL